MPVSVVVPGPDLCQRARAADDARHRERIAAVEGQGRVVDHGARAQLPVVPPLPTCSVPALIVVVPV